MVGHNWNGTNISEQNCMCNSSQQLIQLIINMVGIYFAPGLWLLSQPKISLTWQIPNYTVSWQRHTSVRIACQSPLRNGDSNPATCESSRLRAQSAAAITVYNSQSENSQCLKGTFYHPKMRAKAAKVIDNVRRHSMYITTVCLKNIPDIFSCNLNKYFPIEIIFGTSIT